MADLATLYPQTAPLQGWAAGIQQAQQFMDAQQNNQLNQQRALQDMWKNAQQIPLDLEEKRLINEGKRYTNQKDSVAAQKAQYDFDWEKRFENERYKQTIQEYANKHSAGELQAAATKAKQLMLSQNPQEREQGSRIFNMTEDIQKILIEAKARGDQQARVANIHEAGQDRRAKEANAAKLAAPVRRPPRNLQEQYTYLLEDVRNAKTPEEQAQLQQQADVVFDAMIKARAAGAPAMMAGPNGTFVPNPNYGAQPQAPQMTGNTGPKPGSQENPIILK